MAYSMENRDYFFREEWPLVAEGIRNMKRTRPDAFLSLTEDKLFGIVLKLAEIIDDDQRIAAELNRQIEGAN